ncbi:MAG: hypothetical protein SGPRY_004658 [Prymnesium sp.]
MAHFALRLVDVDFEAVSPEAELDPTRSPLTGRRIDRLPVVRLFGPTPRGQKACLHVHGVFRYFFVPFTGEEMSERERREVLRAMADDLDQELAASAASSGKQGPKPREEASPAAWVYDMTIVRMIPFYGYHEEARGIPLALPFPALERPFVRVTMVLPHGVDAAAKLFARGLRSRLAVQPHEAHIPFLLQFKVDHNLLGMDFVRLSTLSWRGVLPSSAKASPPGEALPAESSPREEPAFRNVWRRGHTHGLDASSPLPRVSSTELEADCNCVAILNPQSAPHEPLQSARRDVRLVQSLSQLWSDEAHRRRTKGLPPLSEEVATPASEVTRRSELPKLPAEVKEPRERPLLVELDASPHARVARSVEVLEAKLAMPLPQPTQSNCRKETPLWSLAAEGTYGEQAASLVDAAGVAAHLAAEVLVVLVVAEVVEVVEVVVVVQVVVMVAVLEMVVVEGESE